MGTFINILNKVIDQILAWPFVMPVDRLVFGEAQVGQPFVARATRAITVLAAILVVVAVVIFFIAFITSRR